jgi:hypothetical protein
MNFVSHYVQIYMLLGSGSSSYQTHLLPEEYVGEFQRPAECHGLQVVNIVISITMQQVELLSPEPFYQPRDVTVIVALLIVFWRGQSHVSLGVDGV